MFNHPRLNLPPFPEGDRPYYWQHRDGGIYRVIGVATSTVDGKSEVVIYEHMFPFPFSVWARPIEEWTPERFKPLTYDEYLAIISPIASDLIEIALFQDRIKQNKADRKASE
jgi:hypothetical protein